MRTSLTYDRGTEVTCCPELMDRLDIDIWFADPHAPWQRGSNENTNGLLRQFLPKGIDLSTASQEYLNHVAMLMNTRPRQTLGWKTPADVMDAEIAELKSRAALAS
jgi:IS30 family transposase